MPKQKTEKTVKKAEERPQNKKLSQAEFETRVLELAEKEMTAEKIGEALRKQGIHPKEHAKISRILKSKSLYQAPELKNIEEKLKRVTVQMEKNIQDKRAMREKERIFSLLRKNKEYHQINQ